MDYEMNVNPNNDVHMEYTASKECEKGNKVKQKAFQSMKELEGWCSEQKASIIMDFVLMLKPEVIVEIGVFGGKSLIPMAYALKENGGGKIFGIDPWSSVESAEGMEGVNKDYWSKVNHDAIMQGLITKIHQFHLSEQIVLIKKTSENADPINNIDILHIDGNHSEKTSLIDVTKWVPYVKKGGIIIFDDVNWSTTSLAVQWLNEHCTKMGEFKGDNIWGVWIKNN